MRARFLIALALAFGPVFVAAPAYADDPFVWENSPIGVYLPEGVTFTAVHGWYGSPNDRNCGADVSDVLTALAVGRNSFELVANNSTFGDPCGGVYKVLRITGVEANFGQQVTPLPEESPTPIESATPTPLPEPTTTEQPVVSPTVEPSSEPIVPTPVPEPVVTPPVISQPVDVTPAPIPFPEPAPAPAPEPAPPTPEPAPVEPAPPAPVETPAPAPQPTPVAPQPPVEPSPAPVVVIAPTPVLEPPTPPVAVVAELAKQDPQTLTDAQVELITQVAVATLASEPQGSPAYNAALDQLMVVAQADDPQVPAELANIPLFGNAAVAVLDAFNQLGNFGSDISPKVRKQAKKEAIATIAVGTATTASTVAAAGSVGYRRKVT